MDLRLEAATLHGSVCVPGSKSEALRLVLAAALADGTSEIRGASRCEDLDAALRCAEALGARSERTEDGRLVIAGCGARRLAEPPRFDCGASGAVLRFVMPVALALCGGGDFIGRDRLLERPLGPYETIFRAQGISCERAGNTLRLRGWLHPGAFRLPGDVSSQFFSGLLFALPLLDAPSQLDSIGEPESADYIEMTRAALLRAGVSSERTGASYAIASARYCAFSATVEGDWSQAAFWLAAAALGEGLRVEGLREDSGQADRRAPELIRILSQRGDGRLDLRQNPDLLPPLAALAALREGKCRLTGLGRLRYKESDRIASVAAALGAMGASLAVRGDELEIEGKKTLPGGAVVDGANDHRVAMLCAVAALRCEKPILLRGADCVNKSYPDFWETYRMLGGRANVIRLG